MSQTSKQEQGSVDPATYRKALGTFVTGVTVVTTVLGGVPVGTTVSAVSALSLSPPLILVSLARKSETLAQIKRAGIFAVNILSDGQNDIAACFATAAGAAKFDGIDYSYGQNGAPVLAGAGATIECDLEDCFSGGDHEILVGLVRNATVEGDPAPLVYFRGRFFGLGGGNAEV
ncbi:flavin reductase domain protein FMN-binding [Parvibaculum lavamentivorans DS-1]|uniref:Flavin reductase domain protein FMN-binding n=1 Tax=Parvibaculum lavamentivorans (strain DS-1 / DSM 13023 / NCIMB 13966) TaxID=402881 RepID=A7HRT4_PARL1|nr:flavin reductase family protein [Parvibaculum lavamentivorans]ABS62617.1 flavin reductase domain protein FMN-binding [Parvibaculum lavamentivorans DS-1]